MQLFIFIVMAIVVSVSMAQAKNCRNPAGLIYNPHSAQIAVTPIEMRGTGILIHADNGDGQPIPDLRAACIPLAIRYNNPGAQKSTSAAGQLGQDSKGHALFKSTTDGLVELLGWIERRRKKEKDTAMQMMERYAPRDDCIGSVDKLPNGECPPGYPLNPTDEYALEVSQAVGKGIHDRLKLGETKCSDERQAVRKMVELILTIEAGRAFCSKKCKFTDQVFNAAIGRVWGKIPKSCQ